MVAGITRAFERCEELLTSLVEGSLSRLLHTRLQPVELAKHLAAAMEVAPRQGPQSAIVPARYALHLNPADWDSFQAILPSLEAELTRYAVDAARERELVFSGPPQVNVVADPGVPVHGVRVQVGQDAGGAPAHADTERIPAVAQRPGRAAPPSPRVPVLSAAPGAAGPARVELTVPHVRVGRAPDNDVVLEDARVSRHHAELLLDGGAWRVVDLDSSNGTFVNGARVKERRVATGDHIQFGDSDFVITY